MNKKRSIYEKYIKRIIDVILSFLALIILSPVLIVIAILVRINLGSPVIFKQKRPGKTDAKTGAEKIFCMYKFRTMTDAKDEEGKLLPDEVRLTKFGKVLRSTSLDELPQLWNIFKGDMSFIGPRPLLVSYLERYTQEQHRRHEVRPGLFGLAAVNGRNAQSWESKFEYDIIYVDNISFKLDICIFLKCIKTVLKREGINEEGSATVSEFKGTKGEYTR